MSYPLPIAGPLGGAEVSTTEITIDDLAGSPSRINETIADLVEANQGYFANRIFNFPGWTVDGGAVIYHESFPQDLFLDEDQSLRPRAPGAQAPLIGAPRRGPSIARVESLSGRFEIYDETRRRGDVGEVLRVMTLVGNTFADRLQNRAISTINAAIDAWGRTGSTVSWADAAANAGGVVNVSQASLPAKTFRAARTQFIEDKAGIIPNVVILNPADAENLDIVYGDKLPALLTRYGIEELLETPLQTEGTCIFAKAGAVGEVAFEKPLDTEESRGPNGTFKDQYAVEATSVLIARNAWAVMQFTGLND